MEIITLTATLSSPDMLNHTFVSTVAITRLTVESRNTGIWFSKFTDLYVFHREMELFIMNQIYCKFE